MKFTQMVRVQDRYQAAERVPNQYVWSWFLRFFQERMQVTNEVLSGTKLYSNPHIESHLSAR